VFVSKGEKFFYFFKARNFFVARFCLSGQNIATKTSAVAKGYGGAGTNIREFIFSHGEHRTHRGYFVSASYSANNFVVKTKALLETSFCASLFVSPAGLKSLAETKNCEVTPLIPYSLNFLCFPPVLRL